MKPVAVVRNDVKEMGRRDWSQIESELVFPDQLNDALDGLDDFSHIVVLFWLHRSPVGECPANRIHPQMRPDLPLVGLFSTRSPVRPNPLGLAIVRLLERSGNVLKVIGLDAIDGTPVLDIKGYLPGDAVAGARYPEWVGRLRQSNTD